MKPYLTPQHWGLPQWKGDHSVLCRLKATRCADLPAFRAWIATELRHPDSATVRPCESVQVRALPHTMESIFHRRKRRERSHSTAFIDGMNWINGIVRGGSSHGGTAARRGA